MREMFPIEKFKDAGCVRIITTDNMVFEGQVASVLPSVELYDDDEPQYGDSAYDDITIYKGDGTIRGISRYEVQSISNIRRIPQVRQAI